MPRILRLVWVDATSGIPLVFGCMLLAIGVGLAAFRPAADFEPGLGDPLNYLLIMTMYVAAVAIGAAAAHTGSLRRKGLLALGSTTLRGRLALARVAALASLSWVLLVEIIALIIVLAKAGPGGAISDWFPFLAVLAVLQAAAASLVGSAVGASTSHPVVPPILALSLCAWLYLLSYAPGRLSALSTVNGTSYASLVIEPEHAVVLGHLTLLLAALGGGLAALSSRPVWRAVAAVLSISLAIAGATQLSRSTGQGAQYLPQPTPICAQTAQVSLCVWPQYQSELTTALATLDTLAGALAPFTTHPRSFRQSGLEQPSDALEFSSVSAEPTLQREAAAVALLPSARCASSEAASRAEIDLVRWALARVGHPDPWAEQPDYAAWSDAKTRSWMQQQLAVLKAPC